MGITKHFHLEDTNFEPLGIPELCSQNPEARGKIPGSYQGKREPHGISFKERQPHVTNVKHKNPWSMKHKGGEIVISSRFHETKPPGCLNSKLEPGWTNPTTNKETSERVRPEFEENWWGGSWGIEVWIFKMWIICMGFTSDAKPDCWL